MKKQRKNRICQNNYISISFHYPSIILVILFSLLLREGRKITNIGVAVIFEGSTGHHLWIRLNVKTRKKREVVPASLFSPGLPQSLGRVLRGMMIHRGLAQFNQRFMNENPRTCRVSNSAYRDTRDRPPLLFAMPRKHVDYAPRDIRYQEKRSQLRSLSLSCVLLSASVVIVLTRFHFFPFFFFLFLVITIYRKNQIRIRSVLRIATMSRGVICLKFNLL